MEQNREVVKEAFRRNLHTAADAIVEAVFENDPVNAPDFGNARIVVASIQEPTQGGPMVSIKKHGIAITFKDDSSPLADEFVEMCKARLNEDRAVGQSQS